MALSLDGTTGITSDGGTPVIENLDTTATGIDVTGVLTTTGNVGIGTSSPRSAGGYTSLGLNNATTGAFIDFSTAGTRQATITGTTALFDFQSALTSPITFSTNGAIERMRIDSSGRVTMPYQPAFNAIRTTGNVYNAVVLWNSIGTNVGSHYSAATGRFTAPVAGNYFFIANAICGSSSTSVSSSGSLQIRINGSVVKDGHWNVTNDTWANVSATAVVTLNTNDYVDVYVQGSATAFMYGASVYSNFSGYLIG